MFDTYFIKRSGGFPGDENSTDGENHRKASDHTREPPDSGAVGGRRALQKVLYPSSIAYR
jgi:hypothetical protein